MMVADPFRALLRAPRAVLFSPHLDDAVLSAGGLVAQRAAAGLESTVATLFAGFADGPFSEFAQAFHRACGLGADPVGVRRAEDRDALAALSCRAVHVDLRDAIYRTDQDGNWSYAAEGATFGPPVEADRTMLAAVRREIRLLCRDLAPDVLIGPSGIGDHVDHVLVRDALLAIRAETGLPVLFWEDLPYSATNGAEPAGDPVEVVVRAREWGRKLDAALEYRSQVPMLFGDERACRCLLTEHAAEVGRGAGLVERYWAAGDTRTW